jgi:orotidine-5'-phosphate decarboxylase
MTFYQKLENAWSSRHSLVCVGLDPDLERIPEFLREREHPIFAFNRQIIDATADLVCAFKPQMAYYSGQDAEDQLAMTLRYLRERYAEIPVILDAKRGDIGSTARMYAREAYDRYGADAVTVNPYLGGDTLEPFLERSDKGVVVLCRTSNPGAGDIQDLVCGGEKVYAIIARKAVREWNGNGNVVLVVGATYPEQLKEVRNIVGEMPLLVPGVGAQGGEVEAVVKAGLSRAGAGMIVNASRSIIFASGDENFAEASRAATVSLRDSINACR